MFGTNAPSVKVSDPQELVGVPTKTLQEINMTGKKLTKKQTNKNVTSFEHLNKC